MILVHGCFKLCRDPRDTRRILRATVWKSCFSQCQFTRSRDKTLFPHLLGQLYSQLASHVVFSGVVSAVPFVTRLWLADGFVFVLLNVWLAYSTKDQSTSQEKNHTLTSVSYRTLKAKFPSYLVSTVLCSRTDQLAGAYSPVPWLITHHQFTFLRGAARC